MKFQEAFFNELSFIQVQKILLITFFFFQISAIYDGVSCPSTFSKSSKIFYRHSKGNNHRYNYQFLEKLLIILMIDINWYIVHFLFRITYMSIYCVQKYLQSNWERVHCYISNESVLNFLIFLRKNVVLFVFRIVTIKYLKSYFFSYADFGFGTESSICSHRGCSSRSCFGNNSSHILHEW